jgi:hypothetical protein
MLRCRIEDRSLVAAEFVPGWSGPGSAPAIFQRPDEVPEIIEHLRQNSEEFGTKFEVTPDALRIDLT